ncbi:hypothetical protein SDC9_199530 [bioreactor metagenome]|uniref:Uncharacterized protein n=1 Tax=bioreactor metagenome TaxID=1076179 RepID=A0A645ILA7_9ZZZZ
MGRIGIQHLFDGLVLLVMHPGLLIRLDRFTQSTGFQAGRIRHQLRGFEAVGGGGIGTGFHALEPRLHILIGGHIIRPKRRNGSQEEKNRTEFHNQNSIPLEVYHPGIM